jgi:hypothetical protein
MLAEIAEKRSIQDDESLSKSVSALLRGRLSLQSELEAIPTELRGWRAKFLLDNRRGPISTAAQYLSPGLAIWLARTYDVVGHINL